MWKILRLNWIAFASSLLLFAAIVFLLVRKEGIDAVVEVWNGTDALAFGISVLLMLLVQGISASDSRSLSLLKGSTRLAIYRFAAFSSFLNSSRMAHPFQRFPMWRRRRWSSCALACPRVNRSA